MTVADLGDDQPAQPEGALVAPPRELSLTSLRFMARSLIPRTTLEEYTVHQDYSIELEGLILTVERKVWSRKIDETLIRFPATWWDAFKKRWFPMWALRRWPALHRCYSAEAYHTYPGLLIKGQEPRLNLVTYELPMEEK